MIQAYFSQTHFLLYSETSLTSYRVRGQKVVDKNEFILSEFDDMAATLSRVKQNCLFKTEDTLIVGLPLHLFNFVSFPLPHAAAENLDEAIGYELTRHIPYELESCLFHTTMTALDDCIQIEAVLALKAPLQHYLAELSAAGLSVTALVPTLVLVAWMAGREGVYLHSSDVFADFIVYQDSKVVFSTATEMVSGSEKNQFMDTLSLIHNHGLDVEQIMLWSHTPTIKKTMLEWLSPASLVDVDIEVGTVLQSNKTLPYKINLVSAQARRNNKFKNWFKIVSCAIFILSLCFYPIAYLVGKNSALNSLEEQLSVVREKAQTLDSLRQDNKTMLAQYERLATHIHSRPQVVDILKELTDIVTINTWFASLEIHDSQLKMRGTAAEATTVIEALASSPLFYEVHFDSPVVKKGSLESFAIVATLK